MVNQEITLYGIPNCDTVKKARSFLNEYGISYTFHDFRKDGLLSSLAQQWVGELGVDVIINKRGRTWQQLPESVKQDASDAAIVQLMLAHPAIIKRPVLVTHSRCYVGFVLGEYQALVA